MATPDADEMEHFQRLSDQYQANLPVMFFIASGVLLLIHPLGSSNRRQKESI